MNNYKKLLLGLMLSTLAYYSYGQDKMNLKTDTVNWDRKIEQVLGKLEKEGLVNITASEILDLNNFAWYTVFPHSTKKKQLLKMAKWIEVAINLNKLEKSDRNAVEIIDTYANLIYKAGKNEKAIVAQKKAIELDRTFVASNPGTVANLRLSTTLLKMEQGQPTW